MESYKKGKPRSSFLYGVNSSPYSAAQLATGPSNHIDLSFMYRALTEISAEEGERQQALEYTGLFVNCPNGWKMLSNSAIFSCIWLNLRELCKYFSRLNRSKDLSRSRAETEDVRAIADSLCSYGINFIIKAASNRAKGQFLIQRGDRAEASVYLSRADTLRDEVDVEGSEEEKNEETTDELDARPNKAIMREFLEIELKPNAYEVYAARFKDLRWDALGFGAFRTGALDGGGSGWPRRVEDATNFRQLGHVLQTLPSGRAGTDGPATVALPDRWSGHYPTAFVGCGIVAAWLLFLTAASGARAPAGKNWWRPRLNATIKAVFSEV
ncbi:unnamed protein product [Cylicocyclus nassatus]|uniref:Uncharacterized protein n=1 Tax=Cylicocyclus nassatus TaxID=53992 RepID=A0AA36DS72_CYLNA|nr:unnamed protein product [Cylicocyclus nassatus]